MFCSNPLINHDSKTMGASESHWFQGIWRCSLQLLACTSSPNPYFTPPGTDAFSGYKQEAGIYLSWKYKAHVNIGCQTELLPGKTFNYKFKILFSTDIGHTQFKPQIFRGFPSITLRVTHNYELKRPHHKQVCYMLQKPSWDQGEDQNKSIFTSTEVIKYPNTFLFLKGWVQMQLTRPTQGWGYLNLNYCP